MLYRIATQVFKSKNQTTRGSPHLVVFMIQASVGALTYMAQHTCHNCSKSFSRGADLDCGGDWKRAVSDVFARRGHIVCSGGALITAAGCHATNLVPYRDLVQPSTFRCSIRCFKVTCNCESSVEVIRWGMWGGWKMIELSWNCLKVLLWLTWPHLGIRMISTCSSTTLSSSALESGRYIRERRSALWCVLKWATQLSDSESRPAPIIECHSWIEIPKLGLRLHWSSLLLCHLSVFPVHLNEASELTEQYRWVQ